MSESPVVIFDRLVAAGPPERTEVRFGTACVMGGSVAGLLAARVLAGYAERVVVIERDAAGGAEPRAGVPQGQHVHVLLPGGRAWMERWLPGLTRELQDAGAVFPAPEKIVAYQDGRPWLPGVHQLVSASRPFLEEAIRARVLGLPNVSMVRAQATGLQYRGDEVSGVRYRTDDVPQVLPAGFVVDATGRASRLPDWLAADGFDRPALRRLPTAINYTTAVFKRAQRPEDLPLAGCVADRGLSPGGEQAPRLRGAQLRAGPAGERR